MLDTENFAHQTDVDLCELKLLRNVKDELTASHDKNLLLRGTCIVGSKTLRVDAIRLAHFGQGRVKTKSLMGEIFGYNNNNTNISTGYKHFSKTIAVINACVSVSLTTYIKY